MMMRRPRGFTLIEVLVSLVVMATMAVIAWRGMDALIKSREISQASLDRSTRLQTVLAQWEQDLHELQDSRAIPALSFDGASLRLTRRHAQGLQVVTWRVQDGALWRQENPPAQTVIGLREGSQALPAVKALEQVSGWQMHYYRNNSWTNAQSTGDLVPDAPQPPASGASGASGQQRIQLPSGVRMILQFAPDSGYAGPLTREIELVRQQP